MVFITTLDEENLILPTKLEVTVTHFHSATLLLFAFQVRNHYLLYFDINGKLGNWYLSSICKISVSIWSAVWAKLSNSLQWLLTITLKSSWVMNCTVVNPSFAISTILLIFGNRIWTLIVIINPNLFETIHNFAQIVSVTNFVSLFLSNINWSKLNI